MRRPRCRPIHTHVLQIAILANMQNGRDTHVRQVKLFAPLTDPLDPSSPPFSSDLFLQQATLR